MGTISHPMFSKFKKRIYKYLEKLIDLIEESSRFDKRRTCINLIEGMNQSKKLSDDHRIDEDLLKKSLAYLVSKPRTDEYKATKFSDFYKEDKISSLGKITLSRKSFKKALESVKATIDEIVSDVHSLKLTNDTNKNILEHILKISSKINDLLAKQPADLSASFFENALFIYELSDRPVSEVEQGFDFDSAD